MIRREPAPEALPVEGGLPPLVGAVEWLNSPPLTVEGLHGKVVLVDFWTYSCINCLRSIPYVRAWADKYKDQGLVVIGVHSPEFAFEKNKDNVKRAVKELKIDYPVAIDSDYAIWRAFGNELLAGALSHRCRGQACAITISARASTTRSEKAIQELLAEAGKGNVVEDVVSVTASGAEAASDEADVKSPETYIGYTRAENFASAAAGPSGSEPRLCEPATCSSTNGGLPAIGRSAARKRCQQGRRPIAFRFHARDLHLVLGPERGRQAGAVPRDHRRAAARRRVMVPTSTPQATGR